MAHTIILNIAGGAGKNIIATAVVESIKAAYPKSNIIISSPWAAVWENNPNIQHVFDLSKIDSFYKDYVYKKDVTLFFLDPYNDTNFIQRSEHIIETWCRLCNVPCITKTPRLFFTQNEKDFVHKKIIAHLPQEEKSKPLFFIQPSGGATNQPYPISWARDLPLKTAQEIINTMNSKGYHTIHIRRNDQLPLEHTTWIDFSIREMMCAVAFSDKRLFVDSLAAHVAGAQELESTVLWVTNSPRVFGYDSHIHIEAFDTNQNKIEFRHMPDSYLDAYNIAGVWSEHPFKDDVIFDTKIILSKLLDK